jgi:chemotaxis protein methyltransferase CheR
MPVSASASAAKAVSPPVFSTGPEHALSSQNFDRLARLIGERVGIQLPAAKRTMLEGRLRRRARTLGVARLDEYCQRVFDQATQADELPHLINAVTTNKTDFFREPAHFDTLAREILPQLAARGNRPIRAWSAACSTGAEPYTLAMVLDAYAKQHGGPKYGILATDIDSDVLATARRGIYARDLVEPVPQAMRTAYVMEPADPRRGEVRITPQLRAAVGFARLNLMDGAYPVGRPMDLIFCRNVLIYFNKATQRKVVARLVDVLAPGGWLFLGHSEGGAGDDDRLIGSAGTIYRRKPA